MDIALANTAANKAIKVGVNTNAWDAIWGASPVVQLTLLALVGMSVVAWAIIFGKRKQLKNVRSANEKFLDHFWEASSLDAIYGELNRFEDSSIARIFKVGYVEMQKLADSDLAKKGEQSTKLSGLDNVSRALRKATDNELSLLDSKLSFLATTGSTGPFIGLFGTVWGIMSAFQKIGQTGAASLAVVAPGISEALISTAIGLAAAIPAVVAFNTFNSKIKKEELELANFTTDFLNIVKRNFFRD